jgi:hypothetical protein
VPRPDYAAAIISTLLLLARPAAARQTEFVIMNSGVSRMDGQPSEARLAHIEGAFEQMDKRLGSLDVRLGSVEKHLETVEICLGSLDTRLGSVEARLVSLETQVQSFRTEVHGDIRELRADMREQFRWLFGLLVLAILAPEILRLLGH